MLAEGKTDERRFTVDLIAALASEQAGPILSAHLETEKSKPVRDAITGALARLAAAPVSGADGEGMRAIDGSPIEIPPVPPLPDDTPLPPEALAEIIPMIAPYNAAVEKNNEEQKAFYQARNWSWFRPQPLINEEHGVESFLALVNGQGGKRAQDHRSYDGALGGQRPEMGSGAVQKAARQPRLYDVAFAAAGDQGKPPAIGGTRS